MHDGPSPTGGSIRYPWRLLFLAAVVGLGALAVGCQDGTPDPGDEDLPVEALEIDVLDDRLDPQEVEIRVPDRYQLIVNNKSSEDCLFSLGEYVRDLPVAAGTIGQIDFNLPPDDPPGPELTMGCEGDEERQGEVSVLDATGSDLGE